MWDVEDAVPYNNGQLWRYSEGARNAPLQKQIFVGEPAPGLPLQILCNPREGEGALPYI